jgi:hypothetical protein
MANLGAKSGCTASTIMCRHIGSMEPNHIENPTRYPPKEDQAAKGKTGPVEHFENSMARSEIGKWKASGHG